MAIYQIDVSRQVKQEMERLPGNIRQRVRRVIVDLANDPHPPRSIELRDKPGRFRLRLDNWRIIYEINEAHRIVEIIAVRFKDGPDTYLNL